MPTEADLRLLLATTFSPACDAAGRAVARLAASCEVELILAHAVAPGGRTAQAHERLDASLRGSEAGRRCRRVLIEADDHAEAIADLGEREGVDAVIAPASGRWRPFSPGLSSFRARLLSRRAIPLWTGGQPAGRQSAEVPFATVACMLDFTRPDDGWLQAADAFARRLGARLFILGSIPPVDEGLLSHVLDRRLPFTAPDAVARARQLARGCTVAGIDIAIGRDAATVNRQIHRCGADLVFASRDWPLREIDRLSCPSVCPGPASAGPQRWSFQQAARRSVPRLTLDAGTTANA